MNGKHQDSDPNFGDLDIGVSVTSRSEAVLLLCNDLKLPYDPTLNSAFGFGFLGTLFSTLGASCLGTLLSKLNVSCLCTRRAYSPSARTSCWCVPCSSTHPLFITIILFAFSTVLRRCAITITVLPFRFLYMASCTYNIYKQMSFF